MSTIDYIAPPTVCNFMRSDAFIRLLAGPVGSGKTTGVIFELLRRACEQMPGPDGIRHTRFAILRQTLSQLKQTVLKDIAHWFPTLAHWKVSESTIYFVFGDVKSEWILMPLDEPEDQRRLLSMQLTGAWISEGIEIDYDLISAISGRVGRYPGGAEGGCTWFGIVVDTNMPTIGSAWQLAMASPPPDWEIFRQPGGLSEGAENLEWLLQTPITLKLPVDDPARRAQGRIYYERQARNSNPNWVTRYVHAEYGPDPSGTAVFAGTFRHSFHVVPELEPVKGLPLIIGQDFGRDPWGVICQSDGRGRFLVLQEIEAIDMGLVTYCRTRLRPAIQDTRYLGMSVVIVGDPSGVQRSSIDDRTSYDVLKAEGFTAIPAGTNNLDPRLRAVEKYLLQQVGGGAAILFDAGRCPRLIQAMNGNYRYSKTNMDISKAVPDKNGWSHVSDALQYACLASEGGAARTIARKLYPRPSSMATRRFSSSAWT